MAWTWTKSWSSADDGSTFSGADIENIQSDISSQAVDLTSTQTISGAKTFSGAVTFPATGIIIGAANQGDIFYDDGTDLARLTPGTSGYYLKTQGASANPIWDAAGAEGATKVVAASDSIDTSRADYVCDGTADDVQIQQAIDAVASKGGEIVLLEGTYNINASIVINAGDEDLILQGNGWGTILKAKTNLNDEVIDCTADRVIIKNIYIDSETNDQSSGVPAVYFNGADYFIIEGCKINGDFSADSPLKVNNCDYFTIRKNLITTVTAGSATGGILKIQGGSLYGKIIENTIDGTNISTDDTSGIYGNHATSGFGKCIIAHNTIIGDGAEFDYGIRLGNHADYSYNSIIGNFIEAAATASIDIGAAAVENFIDSNQADAAIVDNGTRTSTGDNNTDWTA